MEDGELYLAMDNFKQPPPPSPRHNNRRYSETPHQAAKFDPVISSMQNIGLSNPSRSRGNYPHVTPRTEPTRPNSLHSTYPPTDHEQPPPRPHTMYPTDHEQPPPRPHTMYPTDHEQPPLRPHTMYPTDHEQPPPRPKKPTFADELNSRMMNRHQENEEPPPRPYKPPANDHFPFVPQRDPLGHPSSTPSNYGPPVDKRAATHHPYRQHLHDQPPLVHPRHEQEDAELYLRIDNTPGFESNQITEAPFHSPHNTTMENYDHNHMLAKPYPPVLHSAGWGAAPNVTKTAPDVGFHEAPAHLEHWSRPVPGVEQMIPSPTHSHINHRNPMPSPAIGPPSRKSSSKSIGQEIPRRMGSKDSQGSSSSGDTVDVERFQHDYQPRTKFQNIKTAFDDTPFRGPASLPATALPPMTATHAFADKSLPAMKPPHPVASPRRTSGPETSSSPVAKPTSRNVDEQAWYKNVTRSKAMGEIEQNMQDGCFIVRPGKGPNKPYSLTVCSDGAMYNLHIRRREDANYALGSEKENERSFPNVVDLINYYMETPLVLAENRGSVTLTGPPPF